MRSYVDCLQVRTKRVVFQFRESFPNKESVALFALQSTTNTIMYAGVGDVFLEFECNVA